MTLQNLLGHIALEIKKWIDTQMTGMVSIEIHLRQGGISKLYINDRKEINDSISHEP